MSSGGSQVTAATPWGAAQPYLTDIMGQAKSLYGSQSPFYTNPAANFNYGAVTGALGNTIGGTTPFGSMASSLSPATTTAIQQQLSGQPDYTAVKGALDAANQQTWDSFNNQELPQLNQRASFLGNPSGAIKDLNWATANIGRNMDLNAQQQYLGQYDLAQQQKAQAAGLGANIAQGAGSQALQGAGLFGSIAQLPQANLGDYANIVSGTGGKFGTSTTSEKAGPAGTAANIIGGLTAGAGLVNALTGTPVASGIPGAVGSIFGGSALPSTAGAAAGATGALDASTAAGLGSTAGDVAASNSAWLAGQNAAATAAEQAGLGAGADVAGTGAAGAADAAGLGAGAGAADAAGVGAGSAGAGSTAATGGLGAGAGAAAALGIAAIPALLAATVQEHPFDAAYEQRMLQGLNSQPGSPAYTSSTQQLISMFAAGDPKLAQLDPSVLQKARALGLDQAGQAMRNAAIIMQSQGGYAPAMGRTFGVSRNQY